MSLNGHSGGEESHSSSKQASAAQGQLEKCLEMLRNAKNDNEKMASLMLFVHLVKNNTSLTVDSSELFQAIGPRFLVRLLNSKTVPEGCPAFMYKSLAVNILATFPQQSRLLYDPMIISSLHVIVETFIEYKSIPEASELCQDCLKVLLVFSRTKVGCEHFLESGSIPKICQSILHGPEVDTLFEILKGILVHVPQKAWESSTSELTNILQCFALSFSETQELMKFTLCEKLVTIIQSFCECNVSENKGLETLSMPDSMCKMNIRRGLQDILQSRCKTSYKYTALQLAATMIELFGIKWTLETDQKLLELSGTKFWLLLLCIIRIEVSMILEDNNLSEIEQHSDILAACYKVLEKTIAFMVSEGTGCSLSDEVVLKMHGVLVEIIECVIQFLMQVSSTEATTQLEERDGFKKPVIVATVRLLCAWLAEETNSLSDQVANVLPLILDWTKATVNKGDVSIDNCSRSQNEMILYLLPPLCHLSADEKFCCILIEKEFHELLASVFQQLWQKQLNDPQDYPSSLITLCNVFLNLAVLQVELIKSSNAFQAVLDTIMISLPNLVATKSITLSAHFSLLGLLLFRHRMPSHCTNLSSAQVQFLSSVIKFLRQAHVTFTGERQPNKTDFGEQWPQISELWFLSLQNLLACAKLRKLVKELLQSSGWIEEIKAWSDTTDDSDSTRTELKAALVSVVNLN